MKRFIGIEIGGTKLQLVLGYESAKVLERRKLSVDRTKGADGIRKQIEAALPELISKQTVAAIGVGFGGPVDWETGKIARSHQIEGWSEFPLADWIHKLTGVKTVVDNDADVAALGEATRGAGVGFNPAFYVTLGSGVGGGLVVDGKIFHGAKPGESEIGHVRLDKAGTTLESRCSGWAIDKKFSGGAKSLLPALLRGDTTAQKILTELADDLAFGLSHAVHLFHPAIIILGGGLLAIGDSLRAAVEDSLRKYVMEVFLPGLKISLAKLGEDAVPVGALTLARLALERKQI